MGAAGETDLDWAALGQEIRRERLARALSQQQLADQAGLDRKTISHYENGRQPSPGRVPDGYYSVGRVFGWAQGAVDDLLAGRAGGTGVAVASTQTAGQATPLQMYPAVTAFARACAREGADPGLRDAFEEAAERLLQSASAKGRPSSYGLAAYRPHAWGEGDAGVPADDAERIQRRLDQWVEERGDTR
ncbi:helix-turn-helix transcriptional regulator [Streptomyces sp. CB03911]|uniref:helix-turn-helix transcriptional regulator n=1 Tax=Streptomyces sp. CB03911 TaxID=1804758 RepID=UPI00093FD97D|nr:helix-turn-helix transcriptional regulator [Streptomyces sp. CB03911]OKI22236.1 hypothetical protein A6A07_34750 [Streptomyces sp. CB03911]